MILRCIKFICYTNGMMHTEEDPWLEMRFRFTEYLIIFFNSLMLRIFNFIESARLPVSDMTAGSGSLTLSITENITSQ